MKPETRNLKHFLRRFSIYGDFWLLYLRWGTRRCPWFLQPMFLVAFTGMFWLALVRQRRAVARNLGVILPGSSHLMNQLRVFRVFWNFACTIVDVVHVRYGNAACMRWEVCGSEHLKELENGEKGAILLTAHMGNYDVAAPLFANKIHRPIHMVRTPERENKSQEFEKGERDKQVNGNFVIHYNEPGNMLGVTLAQAIAAGDIVAVQGDRILFDVSPMKIPFRDDVEWQVPRGPFALAQVARAAIHPVFIIRMGWRRYRILAAPAIVMPFQDRDRERVQSEAAKQWTSLVRRVGERHWRQWFVLEEMFGEEGRAEGGRRKAEEGENEAGTLEKGGEDETEDRVDTVIPSKSRRGVMTVFFWNLMAGGWTSAVVLRRLLEWAVGDWLKVAGALIVWPVVWFVAAVVLVQAALGLAALLAKVLRLPERIYEALPSVLTLAPLGVLAWSEFRGGCPVGWWLGVLGFAGIGAGLIQEAISRMARE